MKRVKEIVCLLHDKEKALVHLVIFPLTTQYSFLRILRMKEGGAFSQTNVFRSNPILERRKRERRSIPFTYPRTSTLNPPFSFLPMQLVASHRLGRYYRGRTPGPATLRAGKLLRDGGSLLGAANARAANGRRFLDDAQRLDAWRSADA